VDNTPSNGLPPTRTYVISQKYSTRIHADIKPGLSCGGFAWRFQQSATRPSQVPKLRALHIPAPLLRAREKQAFLAGSFKRKPPRTADMGDISTSNLHIVPSWGDVQVEVSTPENSSGGGRKVEASTQQFEVRQRLLGSPYTVLLRQVATSPSVFGKWNKETEFFFKSGTTVGCEGHTRQGHVQSTGIRGGMVKRGGMRRRECVGLGGRGKDPSRGPG